MKLLLILLLHTAALLSIFYVSNWGLFFLSCLIWYLLSHLFGLAIVYHKLFSHRSFVPKKGVAELGTLINILSFKGTPGIYALIHRIHHKHADTDLDPHTPKDNWYRGYFGIIFSTNILAKFSDQEKRNIVKDIYDDFKWVKLLTRNFQLVMLIVFYTVIYTISHNLFAGILVGNIMSIHVGLLINLLGHQKVNNSMSTVNRPWLATLLGPSFNHKYHHEYPGDFNEAGPKNFELAAWLIKNFLGKSNLT